MSFRDEEEDFYRVIFVEWWIVFGYFNGCDIKGLDISLRVVIGLMNYFWCYLEGGIDKSVVLGFVR